MTKYDFSVRHYQKILSRARTQDYLVVPFREFPTDGGPTRPTLVLRHDLDHALEPALLIGEIEATLGVRSTFFVQVACEFYNLLTVGSRDIIRGLSEMGHEIGLHYVSERYLRPAGRATLSADLRFLEDLSGQRICAAAQHLPIDGTLLSLAPEVEIDAYDARFTESPMSYVSDSLMVWRQALPEELIERRQSFQFLAHPENWTETGDDIRSVLERLMKKELEHLKHRYAGTADYYSGLLADRAQRDLSYLERRSRERKRLSSTRLKG